MLAAVEACVHIRATRVEWLLTKGVDALVEDVAQRTALNVAAGYGAEDVLKLFERVTG